MGRLHLAVGTRYERDGHMWVVVQVLRDGRLRVEDQSVGGQEIVTRAELTAAWAEGALRFAIRGRGAHIKEAGRHWRRTRSPIFMCCRRGSGRRRGDGTP